MSKTYTVLISSQYSKDFIYRNLFNPYHNLQGSLVLSLSFNSQRKLSHEEIKKFPQDPTLDQSLDLKVSGSISVNWA